MFMCVCGGVVNKDIWRQKRCRFNPWVRRILWRRAQKSTLVFLPGESYGQRSLVGYSPEGLKESDMTEVIIQYDWGDHTAHTPFKNTSSYCFQKLDRYNVTFIIVFKVYNNHFAFMFICCLKDLIPGPNK